MFEKRPLIDRDALVSRSAESPVADWLNASLQQPEVMVAVVVVSRDRPDELRQTLEAVFSQRSSCRFSVTVVDSSKGPEEILDIGADFCDVKVVSSAVNLGGAGAFALGLLTAIASGAGWIWLMDDDGRPAGNDVLAKLMNVAAAHDLHAVAPVVVDRQDAARFAFPYSIDGRYVFRREEVAPDALLKSKAHLFNGLLIKTASVFAVGLPDLRMFIRGDEVDFMHRMRRAGLRFGTTAGAVFSHPSSNGEIYPIWAGRLHVVVPEAGWKRRCQFRNRAYNFRRYGMWLLLAVDAVRYPYFFLVMRRCDIAGLKEWLVCSLAGLRGKVQVDSAIDLTPPVVSLRVRNAL